jgi:Cu/Ag efflux pump CusA
VTEVVQDHQPLIGDAATSSGPGLLLVVQKTPGADTLAVTRGLEKALDEMRPGLAGVSIDTQVYRPASYLETALRTLGLTLAAGLALMLALLALLGLWRAAVLVLATVPLTLIGTAGLLSAAGAQLTTMTLLGLAVAALVAVDDAVLAGHLASRTEISRGEVAARLLRSRAAVAVAALIVAIAGLPLLALGALPRAFTAPLMLALGTGLAVSTLVGLTITPVLARLLARRSAHSADDATIARSPLARLVAGIGGRRSTSPLRRVPALVAVAVLALVGTVAALPQLGRGHLLPTLQDRDLLVRLQAAPATSLPEMDRIAGRVAGDLRSLAGVSAVGSHVGRAVASDQLVDVNSAEVWITLDPGADYAGTTRAIRAVMRGYPGLRTDLVTYPADRIAQVTSGQNDDLLVRVYGADLTTLQRKAREVRAMLAGVPGVADPVVRPVPMEPAVDIRVDLAAAQK